MTGAYAPFIIIRRITIMKEYIYPAIFHKNDDGSFTVTFPDLPGCITEEIGRAHV